MQDLTASTQTSLSPQPSLQMERMDPPLELKRTDSGIEVSIAPVIAYTTGGTRSQCSESQKRSLLQPWAETIRNATQEQRMKIKYDAKLDDALADTLWDVGSRVLSSLPPLSLDSAGSEAPHEELMSLGDVGLNYALDERSINEALDAAFEAHKGEFKARRVAPCASDGISAWAEGVHAATSVSAPAPAQIQETQGDGNDVVRTETPEAEETKDWTPLLHELKEGIERSTLHWREQFDLSRYQIASAKATLLKEGAVMLHRGIQQSEHDGTAHYPYTVNTVLVPIDFSGRTLVQKSLDNAQTALVSVWLKYRNDKGVTMSGYAENTRISLRPDDPDFDIASTFGDDSFAESSVGGQEAPGSPISVDSQG